MLRVRELRVRFRGAQGAFAALDGISFDLAAGDSLALIGESGSGKTTAALSLLQLLPPGADVSGSVELEGRQLLGLPERALARLRGRCISMVFHDPLAALDPVMRAGEQVAEGLRAHAALDRKAARAAALALFARVGLPQDAYDRYPHQLSGGMRQRVLIAGAVACGPSVLVADEPTSSLDPAVQEQIVALLLELRRERGGIAILLATHDLSLAARLCERIAILYAGRIVEQASASVLFQSPRHPYTAGLLRSLPPAPGQPRVARLHPVAGALPAPWALPSGCRFRDRCPQAQADCAAREPELTEVDGRALACFHPLGFS